MRGRAATIVLFVIVACASKTPPPEPQRSPEPNLPSCLTDADCVAGEHCYDGACVRPGSGPETDDGCPEGCRTDELCIAGVCVAAIDAGAADAFAPPPPCPVCPAGEECDVATGLCRRQALPWPGTPPPDDR